MNYEYIRNFQFDILNDPRKFILSNIETIDGFIRKYPPQKSEEHISDIGLYMYNIRDTNSLLTSGNLTEKENPKIHITINSKDIFKYAYLNSMKRYFDKDFLFGNLSPIVERSLLDADEYMRDLFIIDTIISNQRISVFDRNNSKSIIHSLPYLQDYLKKEQGYIGSKPNIYRLFIDFVKNGKFNPEITKVEIRQYFKKLKEKMLSGSAHIKPQNRKPLRSKKNNTLDLFPTSESSES
jgi:hypothetical protein